MLRKTSLECVYRCFRIFESAQRTRIVLLAREEAEANRTAAIVRTAGDEEVPPVGHAFWISKYKD